MAASNLNVVVITGNLTRDPELRVAAERHIGLRPARRGQHAPQERRTGEWEDKPNYFDVKVWGAQGENSAASSPRAARSRSRDGSSGASGRPRTGKSARQSISSPSPSSSSAAATTPQAAASPPRSADREATCRSTSGTSRPPRAASASATTTFPSRKSKGSDGKAASRPGEARPPAGEAWRPERRPAQAVPALQGQGRPGRLQGRRDAAQVHLREGQDPLAPDQRRLPPPPEPDRARRQARARARAAART